MKLNVIIISGLILACCFFNTQIASGQLEIVSNQISGKVTIIHEMIEMRDGVHLATDIYLPDWLSEDDSLPVALIRTPYNKDPLYGTASAFTAMNWAVVVQDMRGRFASEGVNMIFMNASTDGYDTLQWIASQKWCDGKIGTFGSSALGINQFFMHLAQPSTLKAQAIKFATPDLYQQAIFFGGAFRESLIAGWLEGQGSSFWLPTIYANENFSSFWENVTMTSKYYLVNAPAIHQGGWFDCFTQGTIDGFTGYQYESNLNVQGKSFMMIGPWRHGANLIRQQGEITFPANSMDTYFEQLFSDFFSYYLKGEEISLDDYPAVMYYCMGPVLDGALGNFWRESDVWPIPVEYTEYYLHENNLLSINMPTANEGSESYFYDPDNPVPTLGGSNLMIPAGPYDQSSLETREDVLVFTTEELTDFVEITGRIKAYLWVSSNCTDTDFTVKITDVYPDGRSMLIQDGIVRAKYRNNDSKTELLTPGEIVQVEVDLWSSSYIFNVGHKIRIAISSSNYPRFNANPNNGAPIFSNNESFIAHNTIYHDTSHPSHILLPVNVNGEIPTTPRPTTPSPITSSTGKSTSTSWILAIGSLIFVPICFEIIKRKRGK